MATYRIKPLEWDERMVGSSYYATASTPFGLYSIDESEGDCVWRYCFDEYYDEDTFVCDSISDAKLAAQRHWLERVEPMLEKVTRQRKEAMECKKDSNA